MNKRYENDDFKDVRISRDLELLCHMFECIFRMGSDGTVGRVPSAYAIGMYPAVQHMDITDKKVTDMTVKYCEAMAN